MAEISSFPNNSDEYIGAEDVMRWLHGRTKGVYAGDGNAAVTAIQSSMSVRVAPGIGWMTDANGDGICWWFRDAIELTIDAAESTGTLNRIDRVIVEWPTTDYADKPEVKILKGTSSSSASAPALTNNSTVRQISLARISIPAGTTQLTGVNIIDERLDPTVCGIVTETVTADTSMIAAQYEEALAELLDAIAQAWEGEISDGSITMAKLAPSTVGELQDGLVPYNKAITLTPAHQKQARDNVGASAEWTLIWENSSPSSSFAAQTISLALAAYSYVRIVFEVNNWDSVSSVEYIIQDFAVGHPSMAVCYDFSSSQFVFYTRTARPTTTGVVFSGGEWWTVKSTSLSTGSDNARIIPIKIFAQ